MTISLYQVSFLEEDVAKFNKSSKTRVTWVFRASPTANVADGRDHSISLTWSKKTGKQEIAMDGTEAVWFGRRRGASVFDHRWEAEVAGVPMTLRILATCAPKLHETFRCYDLIINGQVFAYLPYYGVEGAAPAIMPEPTVDGRPGSIFEIIYPNGISGLGEEQRQPEQYQQYQPQMTQEHESPMTEEDIVTQPRIEPEPVDLLG
ncbi:hypothetical protein IV203_008017 [Nitzschia inconspicua]|uniref:Uncharacterized protein n=1 Tax=Nitzschia inconspicua TaxID=303405 RepID=A0A9K3KYV8_9STRA|nr:hypothetical protein IV203_008017 [Nitzschia inconspicua]